MRLCLLFVLTYKMDESVGQIVIDLTEALIREGATQVYAACTHAVLSGPAVERIEKSAICEVVATDSVPLSAAGKKLSKLKILSVADLLARGHE